METALSTDRRGTKWKSRPGQESGEEELSEVGSTRSRGSRSLHSKSRSNPRTRSGTTSSTQTQRNIPTIHAEDNIRSPSSHKKGLSVPVESEAITPTATPTRDSFLNVDEERVPEGIPSPLTSKTDVPGKIPSASPTIVGLTDDSDTDFQSAYSASPKESYGSFDSEQGNLDIANDTLALQIKSQGNVEDRLSAAPKTRRERVSSTSTAIIIRESADPDPNPAASLIPSRSRVPSKHV